MVVKASNCGWSKKIEEVEFGIYPLEKSTILTSTLNNFFYLILLDFCT